MKSGWLPLLLLAAARIAPAQPLDFYRRVDRIFWVVDDLGRTAAGWQRIGIYQAGPAGAPTREGARWSVARLGDVVVDFVQPEAAGSPYHDFLNAHGQGIYALLHRVPTEAALESETKRMRALGVRVVTDVRVEDSAARYILFDTAREGKYVIGLVYAPPGAYRGALAAPPIRPGAKQVVQYAWVARDLQAVSRYWARLGLPEMSYTHPYLWDLRYHDRPGEFDALLGWQKHGSVEYEWIQPTKGPTTYLDHMNRYGEGLHHIAFGTADMDREQSEWSKAGFPTVQSGAWGERDKPGYGRYAYQDAHKIAGIDVELLWNYGR